MNTSINYNELRKLAAKVNKDRPILGSMLIKDEKAYYTNSNYLIAMDGYRGVPNMVVDLNTYDANNQIDAYPSLEMIMNGKFEPKTFEDAIYGGIVIHQLRRAGNPTVYIDNEMKDQIKRLVLTKNFKFDIDQVKVKGTVGLYEVNDGLKIYFGMKRRGDI